MEITLSRKHTNSLYTEGELLINGKRFADTVESTSTMPAPGVYTVSKYLDDYICHGNSWLESRKLRRIIIGTNCFPGIVIGSRPLCDRLFTRFRKGKKPVILTITDSTCTTTNPISHWLRVTVCTILLMLTSCSTLHRTQIVEHATHDTLYLNRIHYDSIYVDNWHSTDRSADTVYIHDILRENHYKLLRDTVRVSKTDSIPVIHEIEKPVKYVPAVYKWSLGICIVSLILLILYIVWKIKF